jgi:hypothetical protein
MEAESLPKLLPVQCPFPGFLSSLPGSCDQTAAHLSLSLSLSGAGTLRQVLVSEAAVVTELALARLLPVVAHTSSASLEQVQISLIALSMRESALISILASLRLGP